MSNFGDELVILRGVRNAGVPDPRDPSGKARVPGKYHPAHRNAAGTDVSARWTGSLALNRRAFTNPQTGQKTEGATEYINVTAWTGKSSAGNGLAERYARFMSMGLEISCFCQMRPYTIDLYDKGVRILRGDGTPIQITRMGFNIIPGSTIIGEEAAKHINDEVGKGIRPQGWNIPGSAGHTQWQALCAKRNAEMYQPGMVMFGYAYVQQPKNAQAAAYPNAPNLSANITVENFTYDQWAASNPNFDEIALGSPRFAAFHELIRAKRVAGGQAVPQINTPQGAPTIVNNAPGAFANAQY